VDFPLLIRQRRRHHGAPKQGSALLTGWPRCRHCGWKQTIRYTGIKHDIPRYSCHGGQLDNGEKCCVAFGSLRVDDAIEDALLSVVHPCAIEAAVKAEQDVLHHRSGPPDAGAGRLARPENLYADGLGAARHLSGFPKR